MRKGVLKCSPICGQVWDSNEMLVTQLCLTLCDPMDCSPQVPLSIEFSRQENWSGLPFPSQGYPPHPGINPQSPARAGGLFIISATREALLGVYSLKN